MQSSAGGLKLVAEDADDLAIISAAVQDAVLKVGDIGYEPARHRVTIALNRFRWESAARGAGERVRAGLQIAGVLRVQSSRFRRAPGDLVAQLLSVRFAPAGEPPGGDIHLAFAGGGELRLAVECVDVVLADISRPWRARARPDHGPQTSGGG
jgi:hypothetical protein